MKKLVYLQAQQMSVFIMSYCQYIQTIADEAKRRLHQQYHDFHYGFPIVDDNELFGRLLLEINQAGLSWEIILKKEANFRKAYDEFSIEKIATYTDTDVERLINNAGIVRNRLKIHAAIENAKTALLIQQQYGSLLVWLQLHYPLEKKEWVKLFKRTFKFTGGEIVSEFLMSIGLLPGAHDLDCPIHEEVKKVQCKTKSYHFLCRG